MESLREHYPLTLRAWLANLEANWTEAVALVGEARARVWRLYVAASAARFEDNAVQVHQVLAVKPRRWRERHAAPPGRLLNGDVEAGGLRRRYASFELTRVRELEGAGAGLVRLERHALRARRAGRRALEASCSLDTSFTLGFFPASHV